MRGRNHAQYRWPWMPMERSSRDVESPTASRQPCVPLHSPIHKSGCVRAASVRTTSDHARFERNANIRRGWLRFRPGRDSTATWKYETATGHCALEAKGARPSMRERRKGRLYARRYAWRRSATYTVALEFLWDPIMGPYRSNSSSGLEIA